MWQSSNTAIAERIHPGAFLPTALGLDKTHEQDADHFEQTLIPVKSKAKTLAGQIVFTAKTVSSAYLQAAVRMSKGGQTSFAAENACRALELDLSNADAAVLLGRLQSELTGIKQKERASARRDRELLVCRINTVLKVAALLR